MPIPLVTAAAGTLLAAASSAPTVVAVDGVLCDITKKLVADQARVICLIPPGADPHTMALRPADRSNLSKAKLVLLNGYNLTPALKGVKAGGPVVSVGEIAVFGFTKSVNAPMFRFPDRESHAVIPYI